jgi:C-terminal processing protease CtpA/Prc
MEEQRNEYRTGPTEPRSRHTGLVAILLILVIFLTGLVSVLSIMNIHLFRLLDEKESSAPLSFSQEEANAPTQGDDGVEVAGMTVEEISVVYQSVQELPDGLYISHVQEGSDAQKQGIQAGDVLVDVEGTPVKSLDTFRNLMPKSRGNIKMTVSRDGRQKEIFIEVDAP